MTTIDFALTFPYRPLNRRELEPVVPLRLSVGNHTADLLALVDTGAQRSLFDGVYLRAAGLDIFSGPAQVFQGFLGAGTTAYIHPVRVQLGDLGLEAEVAFSAHPIERQVLGRDLLYHLALGLRERSLELYFQAEV